MTDTGSTAIRLVSVGLEEEALVQQIFDQIPGYMMGVEGMPRKAGYARDKLTSLPAKGLKEQKHCFLIYGTGPGPVGFIDCYRDYPEAGTAFLSLFLLSESLQRVGLGQHAFSLLRKIFKDEWGARKIRGGVVMSNPVLGFWQKMDGQLTGEAKPYRGEKVNGVIVAVEIPLGESET